MIGTYRPGHSTLHRAPAGLKLGLLVGAGAAAVLLRTPWQVALALLLVMVGYRFAGFGWRIALAQVRPLIWILAATALLHVAVNGWRRSALVVGTIVILVLLAALVTLTTRTTELVAVVVTVVSPLRRLGVDPERVGLLIALGIRCVPIVAALAEEVRDAQRARGLSASVRAFAVPLVVRALRRADALGEALVARGLDD